MSSQRGKVVTNVIQTISPTWLKGVNTFLGNGCKRITTVSYIKVKSNINSNTTDSAHLKGAMSYVLFASRLVMNRYEFNTTKEANLGYLSGVGLMVLEYA